MLLLNVTSKSMYGRKPEGWILTDGFRQFLNCHKAITGNVLNQHLINEQNSMLKSQDTMGNKKCRLLLFQPLKMILNARETCQLVHQLPLCSSSGYAAVIKGCTYKKQFRGGFLLPQTQQFTSTRVTLLRQLTSTRVTAVNQLSSRNLLFCNLGGRKLQRNEL